MEPRKSDGLPTAMLAEIRDARLAKNLTFEELGKSLGLTSRQISDIETGRVVPQFGTLSELLRLLALDLVVVPQALVPAVESLVQYERELEDDPPLYAVHGAEHDLWN